MFPAHALYPLRSILVKCYNTPDDALRVSEDIGLDIAYIKQDSTPINTWHSILREAHKQGKIEPLVNVACSDYPSRTSDFREAYTFYQKNANFPAFSVASRVQSPAQGLPINTVPAPVGDFVGRDEEVEQIVDIFNQLSHNSTTVAISGIRGLGGIGKTELAYAVVQRLVPYFPDGQILLALRGGGDDWLRPEQALKAILEQFISHAELPDELTRLKQLYQTTLTGKKILILADNARDAKQIRSLIPPPGCGLIVTSRQHFLLPGMRTVNLNTLPPTAAEAFVCDICPRVGSAAMRLAHLCGYLPLALRISASLLANEPMRNTEDYIHELENERLNLLQDPDEPEAPETSVRASFYLSYKALSSAEQAVLRQLSVMPAGFDQGKAETVVALPQPPSNLMHLLASLYRCSLLEWKQSPDRYHFHDLVRTFAQEQLSDSEEQAARSRLNTYYRQMASGVDGLYMESGSSLHSELYQFSTSLLPIHIKVQETNPENPSNSTSYLPSARIRHARYYLQLIQTQPDDWTRVDATWSQLERIWLFLSQSGDKDMLWDYYRTICPLQDQHGRWDEMVSWSKETLAIAQEMENKQSEGEIFNNLGVAHTNLGEIKTALDFYEDALALFRQIGDQQSASRVLGNIGICYARRGEPYKAITYFERHLEIAQQVSDHDGQRTALGNLGNIYIYLDEVDRGANYYEDALHIAKLVDDQQTIIRTLNNLGNAAAHQGQINRALECYQQALQIAKKIEDSHSVADILNNLGMAYINLKQADQALDCYQQALVIAKEDSVQRRLSQTLNNMGSAYMALRQTEQAFNSYQQALTRVENTNDLLAKGHILRNLGDYFANLGRVNIAIAEYYTPYLMIAREIGNIQDESIALGNLGNAYARLDRVQEAETHYKQALALAEELGSQRTKAIIAWNFGLLYETLGYYEQAANLMQITVAYEKSLEDSDAEEDMQRLEAVRQKALEVEQL